MKLTMLIFAGLLLMGCYEWDTYSIVANSQDYGAYRLNNKTGEIYYIRGPQMMKVIEQETIIPKVLDKVEVEESTKTIELE